MKATDITRKLVDSGQMTESKLTDPDLIRARNKASTKYPNYDKDTAMLKVLQKGVTDGEKEQKKNKKEHEKFEKDIKDAKTSNDKEHKEFKKDIKDVDKRVDKVEKDMKVNESFQCYTGAKSGKKIQILHGTHSAGVANIICRNDVFVLEIDGRHLGSFYSFEQALEQAEIEDMHFRPEEITKARAYFDQVGRTNVNESNSVDLATKALIAEIVKLIGEGHTEVSPDVITTKVSAVIGKPFMLKDLVTANNNSPALQHYIDSINPTKIKFSTDILTVKNEDPMKAKEKAQSGVANMASRAAGRDRLGEGSYSNKQNMSESFKEYTGVKSGAKTHYLHGTYLDQPATIICDCNGFRVEVDGETVCDSSTFDGAVKYANKEGIKFRQESLRKAHDYFKKQNMSESDGNEGVYSWRSTKNEDGSYNWSVIKVAYQKPVETIKSGNEPTRARAVARAKKAVMPYRRGSVTENLDDAAAEADYNTGHRRGMADAKAGKPSDSSECISKRERDGYAEGYKQLGEGISLKFNNVELNEKQVTPYTKLYFEAHNIERPHGKFINNIRSLKKRKLNESAEHAEIQPFVELIKKLDTHGKVKIGDFFAVLSFEINFAWKEIDSHGFMSPKEITDIKMNENGNINYITFSDGDRYPRLPLASFNNKPITHPAYFNDEKSAKSALTMLRLQLPDEWDLDTSGITGSTEVVDEGKRGTPGFQAFKDSQRKAGKDLSYGGIDRSKKKEEKKDEEEKKDKVDEGWESGPEEREPSVDRSDWDYDQARQEKLDAKVNAQPKKSTYLLVGRGPNMEPNYNFGEEFDDLEAAKAERARLSADPATPNPTMIGIQTINRVVKESTTTTADILKLAGLK